MRVKAKSGRVNHTIRLVRDDKHGGCPGLRQKASDDGARTDVAARAAVAAQINDDGATAYVSRNRGIAVSRWAEVHDGHFYQTGSTGNPSVRADDERSAHGANHFSGCRAVSPLRAKDVFLEMCGVETRFLQSF